MSEVVLFAPSVFEGEEFHDDTEPLCVVEVPKKCAVDLMNLVDGQPKHFALYILELCDIDRRDLYRTGKQEVPCPYPDCAVTTVIRDVNGEIVASANSGCVSEPEWYGSIE
jgi:hypothetical protein